MGHHGADFCPHVHASGSFTGADPGSVQDWGFQYQYHCSLMPFFVLTVAFFQKYDRDAGIGSVISTMLPYSGAFLLGWIVMFTVWYLTGLPLGPGSPLFYGL